MCIRDRCGVICGIDEAGRGPLAGPVVAAAVILDINCPILYVNDSKKLSEKKREELYDEIMEKAVSVGVGLSLIHIFLQKHSCVNASMADIMKMMTGQ